MYDCEQTKIETNLEHQGQTRSMISINLYSQSKIYDKTNLFQLQLDILDPSVIILVSKTGFCNAEVASSNRRAGKK